MAKILVIDDDGIVRDALSVFLTRAGHQVLTAADGANGLQAFKNSAPDLVILDRDLPLMSGSVVFEGIRKASKAVPILILTGNDQPEEAAAYLRGGAAAFLSKADGLSKVLNEAERLLGSGTEDGANCGSVLVAEDDARMRTVLDRYLTAAGFRVILAEDGELALSQYRKHRPDLILLDITMPKKDGGAVLKELSGDMPRAGIMMISGNDDEPAALECLRLGAFDYVPKPVNLENLVSTLKARLLMTNRVKPL